MSDIGWIWRQYEQLRNTIIPMEWRSLVDVVVGITLGAVFIVMTLRQLGLFKWRRLPKMAPQFHSAGTGAETPFTPAPPPAPASRDEILARVMGGTIDRATGEWLLAQITTQQPGAAPSQAHEAFVDMVETMGAAPNLAERKALASIANGDVEGAIKLLESAIGDNPEQLSALAAIVAPVRPELAMEAFSRYIATTVSRPLVAEDRHADLSFTVPGYSGVTIGVVTGDVGGFKDFDGWVNSENDWLTMARMVDRSISANIRYHSARRNKDGVPQNDPMQKWLRPRAYGRVKPLRMGSVRMTKSGQLRKSHNVKRILHVVSVRAVPLRNVAPGEHPGDYVRDSMREAENFNRRFFRSSGDRLTSLLVPMFGTGMAGQKPDQALTDQLVEGLIQGVAAIAAKRPHLKRVCLLAYSTREYLPLRRSFEKRVAIGDIVPSEK